MIFFRQHLEEKLLPNRRIYFARWKNFTRSPDWLVVFAAKDTDTIHKRSVVSCDMNFLLQNRTKLFCLHNLVCLWMRFFAVKAVLKHSDFCPSSLSTGSWYLHVHKKMHSRGIRKQTAKNAGRNNT